MSKHLTVMPRQVANSTLTSVSVVPDEPSHSGNVLVTESQHPLATEVHHHATHGEGSAPQTVVNTSVEEMGILSTVGKSFQNAVDFVT